MKPKSRSQRERERFKILSSRRYPKFFESDKKESMIIIGCGDGPQIPIFSPHVKSILAVDVDRERVGLTDELINQKNIRNCESRQLSIYDVKNLSTKFDTAVLIDIIEHLGNPKKALLSVRKSLRPKGRVLITFPMMFEIYYSSGRMLNRYILKIPEKKGKKYDYHQIKMLPYSWFRLFKEAGFRIRKTNATT
ncbi:MAG: class I SAM-dependent methyltransferase, partial [Nanoarchaeota archaeon]|nr:class I SAM-dependent methyltransferase [Nanoarchaeota archaeon]